MPIAKVRKDVLNKIKPDSAEEKRINEFITQLLRVAEVISKAQPIIVGSLGRGTWLRGDHDVDLFLMFDRGVSRDGLEKTGMENAKEIVSQLKGKFEIKYAEHPYVRAFVNGIKIDIVPCYKIAKGEKIISAVDRSPLHVEYVISKLNPKLRDDVRILKQFCKGIGIYGSDAKNLGISGYICELLVIKYGSFENVMKAVSKLYPGSIIDLENHWDSKKEDVEKNIRKIFRGQPLIVIDPVDRDRNVAAVLSCENFVKFVKKSREFIKRPSMNFFYPEPKPMSPKEFKKLRDRKTKFMAVSFCKPDVIDDILYPQLRKSQERILTLLRQNEFQAIRNHYFVDEKAKKIYMVFEMECWELPLLSKMTGPPIFALKNSNDFLKKYSKPMFGPFLEGEKWVIEKQRNYKTADLLIKSFLDQSSRKLHENGIPDYIAKVIYRPRILQHEEFWNIARNDKRFSDFMRQKYFEVY
jgi:tRNA nucleotidyltransferase (CCA-adding enzyme)